MSFWTKFRVEKNYDMASLQFSIDSGTNWIPVCTDKTKPSSPFSAQAGFDTITPVWDGYQNEWRKEIIDLQDYLGHKLWMRFYFRSDQFSEDWGFAVDNIRIRIANVITSVSDPIRQQDLQVQILPNPGNGQADIVLRGAAEGSRAQVKIRDTMGRLLYEASMKNGSMRLMQPGLAAGCYLVEVQTEEGLKLRNRWFIR